MNFLSLKLSIQLFRYGLTKYLKEPSGRQNNFFGSKISVQGVLTASLWGSDKTDRHSPGRQQAKLLNRTHRGEHCIYSLKINTWKQSSLLAHVICIILPIAYQWEFEKTRNAVTEDYFNYSSILRENKVADYKPFLFGLKMILSIILTAQFSYSQPINTKLSVPQFPMICTEYIIFFMTQYWHESER